MRTLVKGAGHMNWELDVIMSELAKMGLTIYGSSWWWEIS